MIYNLILFLVSVLTAGAVSHSGTRLATVSVVESEKNAG